MLFKKLKKVCFVDTVYTLFLFLLLNKAQTKDVCFFVTTGIPSNIRKNLENLVFLDWPPFLNQRYKKALYFSWLRFSSLFRWPFLRYLPTFGHDHLWFASCLYHGNSFVVIEDGTANYNPRALFSYARVGKHQKFKRILLGPFHNLNRFGNNKIVNRIYLSGLQEIPKEIAEKVVFFDIANEWNKLAEADKYKILSIFNVTKTELKNISKKKYLLLTQPLDDDNSLRIPSELYPRVYKEILKEYPQEEVLIKVHPREGFNYRENFKGYEVFDKPVPMELLVLLNFQIDEAITFNSTAIYSLPDNVKKRFICRSFIDKVISS